MKNRLPLAAAPESGKPAQSRPRKRRPPLDGGRLPCVPVGGNADAKRVLMPPRQIGWRAYRTALASALARTWAADLGPKRPSSTDALRRCIRTPSHEPKRLIG